MAATKGRALRVRVATTATGTYNVIVGIRSATLSMNGQNVDVSTLTDADVVRLQGIKDATISMEGNYEADATGQGAIRSALANDSDLFMQFLPDGTTGFRWQVKPSKYEISGAVGDKMSVSIEAECSGAVTAV